MVTFSRESTRPAHEEVLRGLDLSDNEIAGLRKDGVVK